MHPGGRVGWVMFYDYSRCSRLAPVITTGVGYKWKFMQIVPRPGLKTRDQWCLRWWICSLRRFGGEILETMRIFGARRSGS